MPLHYACAVGNKNLVKRLLEYDIEKLTKDNVIINDIVVPKGFSALAIAILFEQEEIINIICKYIELHYYNFPQSKIFRKIQHLDDKTKELIGGSTQLTVYQYGIIKMVKTPLFYVTQKLFKYCHSQNDINLCVMRQNWIMILSYAQYLLLNPSSDFNRALTNILEQNQSLLQSTQDESMGILIKVLQFATQNISDPNIDLRQQQQIDDIIAKLTINIPQLVGSDLLSPQLDSIVQQLKNYGKITQRLKEQQLTFKYSQSMKRSFSRKRKSSASNANDSETDHQEEIAQPAKNLSQNLSANFQVKNQNNSSGNRNDDDEEPQITFEVTKALSSLVIKANKKTVNLNDIDIQLDALSKEIDQRRSESKEELKMVKMGDVGLLDDVDDEIESSVRHEKNFGVLESTSVDVNSGFSKLRIMKNTKKARSSAHLKMDLDDDDWGM